MTSAPQKKAVLYRMVMPKHICPYGIKARWLLRRNTRRGHLDDAVKHYGRTREKLDDLAVPTKKGLLRRNEAIHPQYLARTRP